jgi:hypothetical protein
MAAFSFPASNPPENPSPPAKYFAMNSKRKQFLVDSRVFGWE